MNNEDNNFNIDIGFDDLEFEDNAKTLSKEEIDELDEIDAASEYNDTANEIAEMETQLAEVTDNYHRLFAEFDNFRKRTTKEKTEAYGNATAKCVESILPVFDNFERAVEAESADESYKNGMLMIFNQLKEVLSKLGVTEIEALGQPFNPNVHNAISKTDSDDFESDYICQVYQKGYKIGERLIRPAMVVVAN